ncbi:glutathione S-transferase [Altericroceibacterium endophyticum]|uniref:Glutathione S-transferase n=1 Tax=Altericroceibacterium endophyticum TaxID=1808508 RepID=A0A6I4SZR6_9SPHN|nr:glutathione S-transferase [Altericroceibacterium endophyticum]MXO64197.1 glutathione S-transferase [Altericroceibacterium endophyticum]
MVYDFWYWPTLPGRGDFIRYPLEAAQIPYTDCARDAEDGFAAVAEHLEAKQGCHAFAVPLLETGSESIAQTANILLFLNQEHGLGPSDAAGMRYLNQLQCDIADITEEVHAVHHPISTAFYYEDQRDAAIQSAEKFREQRIPKYLAHFERIANAHDGDWLLEGDSWSTGDTSIAYLLDGLHFMFPLRMAALQSDYPTIHQIQQKTFALEYLDAYRASDRCAAFGTEGIFRNYPELDAA